MRRRAQVSVFEQQTKITCRVSLSLQLPKQLINLGTLRPDGSGLDNGDALGSPGGVQVVQAAQDLHPDTINVAAAGMGPALGAGGPCAAGCQLTQGPS